MRNLRFEPQSGRLSGFIAWARRIERLGLTLPYSKSAKLRRYDHAAARFSENKKPQAALSKLGVGFWSDGESWWFVI